VLDVWWCLALKPGRFGPAPAAGRQLSADPLDGVRTMPRDIDSIITRLARAHPQVAVEQLRVSHPGDDDGIWFFKVPGSPSEAQLESSTGMCPFAIESDATEERAMAVSVDDAISSLERLLGL
jgi:hypothetical protein